MSKIVKIQKWGCYVLHNTPFYLIEVIPKKPTFSTVRVIRSFYDLQKSAAKWHICDYGVIKSPVVNT